MRLTVKLSLALLPGILVVLVASAYLEMRRDIAAFNIDSRRDDQLIGSLVTEAVNRVWNIAGRDQALQLLKQMESGPTHQHRLRWLDAGDRDALSKAESDALARGEPVWRQQNQPTPGLLYVYAPLMRDGQLAAVLEISEPLANEQQYAARIGLSTLVTTLSLAAVSLMLTTVLGIWLVGRPIAALIDQARRVGAGDFSGQLQAKHTDEIGELVTEMQAMTQRLANAAQQVSAATTARITTLEQLRHADRLNTVGKLASGVAHELGTPLNVVSGRAQLIIESSGEPQLGTNGANLSSDNVTHARIIIEQARRMAGIIRQLLDFARQRPTHKDTCDLHQLAAQTATMLATLAEKQQVKIEILPTATPYFAEVDSGQIQQVFTNIMVNAIQAMPGGGAIHVALGPSTAKPPAGTALARVERAEITIGDQGVGIPGDVLTHIFEPFYTTKPIGVATGLGLSVAYGIVQDHDGFITVESQPEQGTRFGIHLPLCSKVEVQMRAGVALTQLGAK